MVITMFNFHFPTLSTLIRGAILAIILGLIGFYLFPMLGLETLTPSMLFALALGLGVILSVVLSSLYASASLSKTSTLYVGNLAYKTNESALRDHFAQYGPVISVRIMKDRMTRRPRGFAFVEMEAAAAKSASRALNGVEFNGRPLKINKANQRKEGQEED